MDVAIKTFTELTMEELYVLLALRSEVFVVEQQCVYQDIDGKDTRALHVMGYTNGKLVAYTRCFGPGDYFEEAAIGRVVVQKNFRNLSYGHKIVEASIIEIQQRFNTLKIKLSAQQYLIKFYESHGFRKIGQGYMEDGIPHVAMIRV